MNEYDLYYRIISPDLMSANQNLLVENKNHKPQKVELISDGFKSCCLYRYDMDERKAEFLPFFNKNHSNDGPVAPEGLLSFCDYIILAEKNDKLFVVLVELKSGDGAIEQLMATTTFMEYVKATAQRISIQNKYSDISPNNIITKRVIVKPVPGVRLGTNVGKSSGKIDWGNDPIVLVSPTLPLLQICK